MKTPSLRGGLFLLNGFWSGRAPPPLWLKVAVTVAKLLEASINNFAFGQQNGDRFLLEFGGLFKGCHSISFSRVAGKRIS